MPILTETPHAGGFLVWEALRDYCRSTVILASGNLQPGTILGKITASGKYAAHDPAASNGTQTAAAILGYNFRGTTWYAQSYALLTGRGRFGDDLGTTPGTLHAAVLRSPHAHARLLAVDTAAALALPGVHAVLTGQDVQRWQQPFVVGVKVPMQHFVLAVDKVRYAGEPVAVVVAQSRYIAEDALDLLRADYEALPAVVDIEAACEAGAAVLHEAVGSNVVSDRSFCYGDPDASFAAADRRVALTVHYPRNSCTPIEGAVVIAECLAGGEGYEVTSNFMGPFSLHSVMALALAANFGSALFFSDSFF